jgi:hypothetical protein
LPCRARKERDVPTAPNRQNGHGRQGGCGRAVRPCANRRTQWQAGRGKCAPTVTLAVQTHRAVLAGARHPTHTQVPAPSPRQQRTPAELPSGFSGAARTEAAAEAQPDSAAFTSLSDAPPPARAPVVLPGYAPCFTSDDRCSKRARESAGSSVTSFRITSDRWSYTLLLPCFFCKSALARSKSDMAAVQVGHHKPGRAQRGRGGGEGRVTPPTPRPVRDLRGRSEPIPQRGALGA